MAQQRGFRGLTRNPARPYQRWLKFLVIKDEFAEAVQQVRGDQKARPTNSTTSTRRTGEGILCPVFKHEGGASVQGGGDVFLHFQLCPASWHHPVALLWSYKGLWSARFSCCQACLMFAVVGCAGNDALTRGGKCDIIAPLCVVTQT